MKHAVIVLLLVATTVAQAAPRQILVLRAEGTADATSRATVERHVMRLAKHIDGKVEPGDITLSDAAAAAGCNVADAACKDEILMTFAVDEIVTTTVSAAADGQLTVTVRRLTTGAAPRAAASTLLAAKVSDARIDQDLGPLFDLTPPPTKTEPPDPVAPPSAPATIPPPAAPVSAETLAPRPGDPMLATAPQPTMLPMQSDSPMATRKWEKIGMGVGAGLVVLSFIMWTQASGLQTDIDSAPTNTPEDFRRLRDLEQDADGLAGGGNLFFVAGLVVGGIGGYYYWKKGRDHRAARSARITPTVMPGGAGVVLTFGGAP